MVISPGARCASLATRQHLVRALSRLPINGLVRHDRV